MAKNISMQKPNFKNKRSKALNATKSKQSTNLQTHTINGIKVRLTAREARAFKKMAS